MKLIFIRHGDPDYENDCLTAEGRAEAEALRRRVATWGAFDAYTSPLGRAQETCRRALGTRGETPTTLPWLHEFRGELANGEICWDLAPSVYAADPALRDPEAWVHAALYQNTNVAAIHAETQQGLHALLAQYGYRHEGAVYRTDAATKRDAVAVLFCHQAITLDCLAGLLNIAAPCLWQQTFLPPASITVLGTEEHEPGYAQWRMQAMGDVRHLHAAGVPVSPSGYFATVFEG